MNATDLSHYKLKLPIEIRFADFDMLSHVNNAKFLTYLEEARIEYFNVVITRSAVDWRQEGIAPAIQQQPCIRLPFCRRVLSDSQKSAVD